VVRDYELMYIVRPDLDDEALRTATESVDALIRGLGGTVGKTTMWGKRRLAYEVDRLRDGHYVITLIQLDGARVADLERALQIHDTVFRHMLVRRDETLPLIEDGEAGEAATGAEPSGVAEDGPAGDEETSDEDEDIPEAEIAEEEE
jgi:small subunit ribosomal protein S6